MEENVALDSTKQRKFVKSIKGIKKLIKKNESEKPTEVVEPVNKPKRVKPKRKRPDRGLVYLSHIPHGFYEHQMTEYFKQFGVVTNSRVIRSKRTGNSKGFAFVEFKDPTVAEIVAETMNNYLMGKRLIKAAIIPPEKQKHRALRKHWSTFNNPGRDNRLKMKKAYNENKDEKGDLNRARKILSNLNKTKKKLSEMGIDYDFFSPVDVPEALQSSENKKETVEVKDEKISKKGKKESKPDTKVKIEPVKSDLDKNKNKKGQKKTTEIQKDSEVNNEIKNQDVKKGKKKDVPLPTVNKKEQKQKQQKLKDAGVKPPENFVKVQEHSEDSDSSIEFDSDEYEKLLEDDGSDVDSGDDSSDQSEGEDTDDDGTESEEEEIVPPPKKSKGTRPLISAPKPKKEAFKQKAKAPEPVKRKEPQKAPVVAKKPKFEKQSQQPMKKQFKKKK